MSIRTYSIVIYDRVEKKYIHKEILLPVYEEIVRDRDKVHNFNIRVYDGGWGYTNYSYPVDRFTIVDFFANDSQVEV